MVQRTVQKCPGKGTISSKQAKKAVKGLHNQGTRQVFEEIIAKRAQTEVELEQVLKDQRSECIDKTYQDKMLQYTQVITVLLTVGTLVNIILLVLQAIGG